MAGCRDRVDARGGGERGRVPGPHREGWGRTYNAQSKSSQNPSKSMGPSKIHQNRSKNQLIMAGCRDRIAARGGGERGRVPGPHREVWGRTCNGMHKPARIKSHL